jgi:hypothetical protein
MLDQAASFPYDNFSTIGSTVPWRVIRKSRELAESATTPAEGGSRRGIAESGASCRRKLPSALNCQRFSCVVLLFLP